MYSKIIKVILIILILLPLKILVNNYFVLKEFYWDKFFRDWKNRDYSLKSDYTGKMSAGYNGETFISPSLLYAQRYDYGGVTLEFKLNPGTTNELMNIGVKNKNQVSGIMVDPDYNYLKLPKAPKGWGSNHAMFKLEKKVQEYPLIKDEFNVNIGLGKRNGKTLEIFNNNIIDYKIIRELKNDE